MLPSRHHSSESAGLARGHGRIDQLPLARLRFGLSPRFASHDPELVDVLAEITDRLPPIVVHASTMRVIDGVHRVLAARSVGRQTIAAVLFHGDESEAVIQAVASNVTHGKPLTLPEREAGAATVIGVHPEWSDRRIAEICGISPKTVASVRQRTTEGFPRLRTRVGRDGRTRSVDPIEVRRRIAEALKADPNASIRAIAARTASSQGTVRDVSARLQRGESILPPRQAEALRSQEDAGDLAWTEDQSLASEPAGAEFAEWFDSRLLRDDAEWEAFVDSVPVSRIYEVADAARRCADAWQRFATAMESRVRRGERRSPRDG